MGFRDDRQIAACCVALCNSVRMGDAWTLDGPTAFGIDVRDGKTGVSSGEDLMVRIAFDLWNGEGGAKLSRVLGVLDGERMRMVATLLVATVTDYAAIDAWLAQYGDARGRN